MFPLTEEQIQNVADKMMKVIPYNVNIMNEKGIIVGSGDSSRINQLHYGAVKALTEKSMVDVYENTENVKMGVNTPIFFQDKIVGVIGITGYPDEVRPFVELLRVTAELLINQEHELNERQINEQLKEKFLYEWAYKKDRYSKGFIERGLSIGIDVTIERCAIIFSFNKNNFDRLESNIKEFCNKQEFYIKLNPKTVLAFLKHDTRLSSRLDIFSKGEPCKGVNIGVGTIEEIMYKSVKNALNAVDVGKNLNKEKRIHQYKDLAFISTLIENFNDSEKKELINSLDRDGKNSELIETLVAYINMNGEMKSTSHILHIHRNTLTYRLDKIYEITNKNPRNLVDLFELFTAYIVWKSKGHI